MLKEIIDRKNNETVKKVGHALQENVADVIKKEKDNW